MGTQYYKPDKMELAVRWKQKIARRKFDIEGLVARSQHTSIAVVTSRGSAAWSDIRHVIKPRDEDAGNIHIAPVWIAWEDQRGIGEVISRTAMQVDMIVIARGGGDDVHNLDSNYLIEIVSGCPCPIAIACGHADDKLVLASVSDYEFSTPTDFAHRVKQWIEKKPIAPTVIVQSGQCVCSKRAGEQLEAALQEAGMLRKANQVMRSRVDESRSAEIEMSKHIDGLEKRCRKAVQKTEKLREKLDNSGRNNAEWWQIAAYPAVVVCILALIGAVIVSIR